MVTLASAPGSEPSTPERVCVGEILDWFVRADDASLVSRTVNKVVLLDNSQGSTS